MNVVWMAASIAFSPECGVWRRVDVPRQLDVVGRFLDVRDPHQYEFVDAYYVYNTPVAAIVGNEYDAKGSPVVTGVYMNKGMILLVDCSGHMRNSLFHRYRCIDMSSHRAFMEIP